MNKLPGPKTQEEVASQNDDYSKVVQRALDDFKRNDFSGAEEAVDTLGILVKFYKDLAENYLELLTEQGNAMDEYGSATNSVFCLMEDGGQRLGYSEVLNLEDHSREDLWFGYVKDYVPFASLIERVFIAEHFSEFIEKEGK